MHYYELGINILQEERNIQITKFPDIVDKIAFKKIKSIALKKSY